jgi:1-phosphofructokinase
MKYSALPAQREGLFKPDERSGRLDVGGKGLNVAVVLGRLGVPVNCVGCLGIADERTFMDMVAAEGIDFRYIPLPGKTRTNLKIFDQSTRTVTEFNEPGLRMDTAQRAAFMTLLAAEAAQSDFVVFSGRLPQGCAEDTYARCMEALPDQRCVLDAAGEALRLGLAAKPFLVKPNLPELEALTGRALKTLRAIRDAALELVSGGARHAIVSMGKYGAVYTDGTHTLFAPALQVAAHSTVGAGDAMVGGLLMGLTHGEAMEDCLRYGVAAAAASVMTEGTQLINVADFEALLPKATLQAL